MLIEVVKCWGLDDLYSLKVSRIPDGKKVYGRSDGRGGWD